LRKNPYINKLQQTLVKKKTPERKMPTLPDDTSDPRSGGDSAEPNPIDEAIVDEVEKRRAGEKTDPRSESKGRRLGNTADAAWKAKKGLGARSPGRSAAARSAAVAAASPSTKDVKDLVSQMKDNVFVPEELRSEEPSVPPSPKPPPPPPKVDLR
jgi:hypothetical protein